MNLVEVSKIHGKITCFRHQKTPGMSHIQVRFVLTLVEIVSSSFSRAEKTRPF
jgi:hypothetical protein